MDVKHALAGFAIGIEDCAEPAISVPVLLCDRGRAAKHRADEPVVLGREMVERRNVRFRDEKHVEGSLRVDVRDDNDLVVFVDRFHRDLARHHSAEQAITHCARRHTTVRGMSCRS
jgi:hypothetical protein